MAATSNSYGAVELPIAHDHDTFLQQQQPPRRSPRAFAPWAKLAVGAVVGLAGLGYVTTMQSSLQSQQTMLLKMQQQLDAMHSAMVVNKNSVPAAVADKVVSHSAQSSSSRGVTSLPHKFAVDLATPLKTQDNRGTCWDFATVAVLEYSYREQGIREGWLQKDEYLALSEQAYGAEVLRLCSGPAGSPQQVACLIPGNEIWKNSTEGGESAELYYLINGLKNSVFPNVTCPYEVYPGNDTRCDALTPEKRAVNPLSLSVKKMETYYEERTIKTALLRDRRAMAFTTSMPYITHYFPCIGEFTNDERCNPTSPKCTLCPPELSSTTCCIAVAGGENYNMHGEFIARSRGMTLEGGHVMTLVGYNDLYRTKDGVTGGYILKNSWWDGINPPLGTLHARGSHSIKYWLQEISDWEERSLCPNSYNPANWYQCGASGEVVHAHGDVGARVPLSPQGSRGQASAEGVQSCLSDETKLYAETNLQPLHLKCTDETYCNPSAEFTYFASNSTEWGDRMEVMCLFEYNTATKNTSELCLPPMTLEKIAYVFAPVADEIRENDPDVCGFYFYPYEIQQQYVSKFGNFYVNNYWIDWSPQSYAANKNDFPELDYSDIEKSTFKQRSVSFVGPFPFAKVVPKHAWPHGGDL